GEVGAAALEEPDEARIVRFAEGMPGIAAVRQGELHVAALQEPEAEFAVHQRQAGADELVAFPSHPQRPPERGAEVDGRHRVERDRVGGRAAYGCVGGWRGTSRPHPRPPPAPRVPAQSWGRGAYRRRGGEGGSRASQRLAPTTRPGSEAGFG